jgi:hypothetical protein
MDENTHPMCDFFFFGLVRLNIFLIMMRRGVEKNFLVATVVTNGGRVTGVSGVTFTI